MSTKSHIAVYWRDHRKIEVTESEEEIRVNEGLDPAHPAKTRMLHFRESDEDFEVKVPLDSALATFAAVLPLEYDIEVTGRYCEGGSEVAHVTGRETCPDVYQFHVKKEANKHNFYNSHHFPNANEWHIMGSITDEYGKIGVAVVQTFRRIYYQVLPTQKRDLRKITNEFASRQER
jgi:hypothetical protein